MSAVAQWPLLVWLATPFLASELAPCWCLSNWPALAWEEDHMHAWYGRRDRGDEMGKCR